MLVFLYLLAIRLFKCKRWSYSNSCTYKKQKCNLLLNVSNPPIYPGPNAIISTLIQVTLAVFTFRGEGNKFFDIAENLRLQYLFPLYQDIQPR